MILCFVILLCLLFTVSVSLTASTTKILIIGIGGCRQTGLVAADTPPIDGLLTHAIYCFDALCEYPTWSGTGWSAMLTLDRFNQNRH